MRLSSGKAVEEYKTALEASKQSEPEVRLDPKLEMGYELEMQKQAGNQSAGFDY